MLPPELLQEGERQMTICNACRYCEGYCAVFPAMELRRNFTKADLTYLANLCFDCRDCYYSCQYAPPHEFAVNVPKLMSQLRVEAYREFSSPAIFSALFRKNGLAVSLITFAALAIIVLLVLGLKGPGILFGIHLGEGAFYRVVPFLAMTIPALAMALYGLTVLLMGMVRFWRETQGHLSERVSRIRDDGFTIWSSMVSYSTWRRPASPHFTITSSGGRLLIHFLACPSCWEPSAGLALSSARAD